MKVVTGDLIGMAQNGEFDAIIHGCNCFNKMGSGIAKSIKVAFPQAFAVDRATIAGNRRKLGTITYAHVNDGGGVVAGLTVINRGLTRSTGVGTPWKGSLYAALAIVVALALYGIGRV